MNDLESLKAGRELISDKKRWIKGNFARTSKQFLSSPVFAASEKATCWCSVGALMHVNNSIGAINIGDLPGIRYLNAVSYMTNLSTVGILDFNDHIETSHADVLKVWDTAIKIAEANV
jgi:hypothetical protein